MATRKRQKSQRDILIDKVLEKHAEQDKKYQQRLAKMRKAGGYTGMETPLWMQDWEFPVLMYKSTAHLTLEDIVDIILKELE